MSIYKIKDGRREPIEAGEEQKIKADWLAEEQKPVPPKKMDPLEAAIREIAKGYGTTRRAAILAKLEGK